MSVFILKLTISWTKWCLLYFISLLNGEVKVKPTFTHLLWKLTKFSKLLFAKKKIITKYPRIWLIQLNKNPIKVLNLVSIWAWNFFHLFIKVYHKKFPTSASSLHAHELLLIECRVVVVAVVSDLMS